MMVASFPTVVSDCGWCLAPRTRYVLSDGMYHRIIRSMNEEGRDTATLRYSSFNHYRRNYCGQDLTGKTLAIFRESGRGDHLILTALCGWIKSLYPSCTIEVYGAEDTSEIWLYNPEVIYMDSTPTFEGLTNPACHYHLLLEGLMEADTEPDQPNCYDGLFNVAGFDPRQVPDEWKRPRLFMGKFDQQMADGWQANHEKVLAGRPYVLAHWNPSGTNRMYPPELYERALRLIAEQIDVVIVGNTHPLIPKPDIDHPRILSFFNGTHRWRQLLPMIAGASVVVCPDSSVAHGAALYPSVPVVGLWGPFSDKDRVRYYRNHHALSAPSSCPHAPCRKQFSELPRHLCRDATGYTEDERWCRAMAEITPEQIAEAVLQLV